jgi:hypothetical protein
MDELVGDDGANRATRVSRMTKNSAPSATWSFRNRAQNSWRGLALDLRRPVREE